MTTPTVTPRKLWFGLVGSATAWLVLGFIDLMIVWAQCAYVPAFGVDTPHAYARTVAFIISVLFLLVAVTAGVTSYRNWRALSGAPDLLHTTASDRREFMAVLGVIISVTLGAGIVLLALAPLIVRLCVRAK